MIQIAKFDFTSVVHAGGVGELVRRERDTRLLLLLRVLEQPHDLTVQGTAVNVK